MLLKKYSIMLLTAVLCLTITILTDILFGFPWYNFIINWRFTLFSPVERITVILLLALLVIPDLYRSFRKRKHETSPPRASGESDSGTGSGSRTRAGCRTGTPSEDGFADQTYDHEQER